MIKLIFGVLVLVAISGLLFENQDVFGSEGISDKIEKFCEDKYETYKKMGESYLKQKFSHVLYLDDCFHLYVDKN